MNESGLTVQIYAVSQKHDLVNSSSSYVVYVNNNKNKHGDINSIDHNPIYCTNTEVDKK